MADIDYLKQTTNEALIQGFQVLARLQPQDPIDFFGKWLLRRADALDLAKQAQARSSADAAPAETPAHDAAQEAAAEKAAADADSQAKARIRPEAIKEALALLSSCHDVDAGILNAVANHVKDAIKATGVYFAEKVTPKGGAGGGDEGGGSGSVIKYAGCSTGQEFVLESNVKEGEGVTWKSWIRPEVPEGEAEEEAAEGEEGEDAANKPPKPPPELPTIHVPNVLRTPDVIFLQLPRPGAFVAAPIDYGCLVHDAALPAITADAPPEGGEGGGEGGEGAPPAEGEAEAKEDAAPPPPPPREEGAAEGGEGKEGGGEGEGGAEGGEAGAEGGAPKRPPAPPPRVKVPPGNAIPRFLALCADTLGQNRDFTEEQIDDMETVASAVKAAYMRVELAAYRQEYLVAKQAFDASAARNTAALEAQKAAQAAAEQVTTDEAAKLAEGAADEYKANIKAEAALNANKEWFSNNTEEILALASRKIQPKAEVLAVLTQAWFYLGVKKEALGDPRAPDPAAFDWSVARHKLHGSFINSILEKDPATIPTAAPAFVYQRGESIKTVLTALTPEQLAPEGSGILALQSYLVSAVDFREANAAMLKKKKEEEDERKAKEEAETKAKEEADAAAAAAAAEAAAAGGEGAPADAPAE